MAEETPSPSPHSAPTEAERAVAKARRKELEALAQSRAGDKATRKDRGIFTGAAKPKP